MRFILGLATLCLISSSCLAQAAQIDRIDIASYGLYTGDITGSAASSAVGTNNLSSNIRHAATTKVVPAQIGVRFGFEYTVVGTPSGAAVNLTKVEIFPPAGLDVPGKGPVRRDSYVQQSEIGGTIYTGYRFDNAWELVPGIWRLELWDGKRRLASEKFKVVRQ